MLTSSKTYDIITDSGFISLPSRRTLRDYTHWMKMTPGFNAEVINHLWKEANVDKSCKLATVSVIIYIVAIKLLLQNYHFTDILF